MSHQDLQVSPPVEADDSLLDVGADPSADPFAALGLSGDLAERLATLGYAEPTPIQMQAIPPLLAGRDLVGQAATGTGKTAAFTLPLVERLAGSPGGASGRGTAPAALILVPTRELATQVAAAALSYGSSRGVRVLPIFGGAPYDVQLRSLQRGVDVVVATPGRALDHIKRGTLKLSGIQTVVLDEADEMLAMGFIDDIETILEAVPATRQVALFSATMPGRIAAVARRHLKEPVNVAIAKAAPAEGAVAAVRQTAYVVPRTDKLAALKRVLDFEQPTAAIIFCRTRMETDDVTSALNARGHRAEALHGGMNQQQRDRVMKKLRDAEARLVVATDIAARGLDIEQLSHVFNYDMPDSPETYVHRVGRIGRAGRSGVAITMAEPRHRMLMRDLERITRQPIHPARVPTVADIAARRLSDLSAGIRQGIADGGLEPYRAAVNALMHGSGLEAAPLDPLDIAAAALRLAAGPAAADGDSEEIVDLVAMGGKPGPAPRTRPRPDAPMGRLFVNAGRDAGVRAGDLVGAIAGESGISGRDIGAIRIENRHSMVEIRADLVDQVVAAMGRFTLSGKPVTMSKARGERPTSPFPMKKGPVRRPSFRPSAR